MAKIEICTLIEQPWRVLDTHMLIEKEKEVEIL